MIIFNIPGILIVILSFGVAFGAGELIGFSTSGPFMVIAGPLAAVCDLVYRIKWGEGHWFHPGRGGHLFFLPVWSFGALWFVLGIVYVLRGEP